MKIVRNVIVIILTITAISIAEVNSIPKKAPIQILPHKQHQLLQHLP